MKNKFIVQICFQFILLNYSGAQTQDARYGSDITATTPLVPLRVLVVFVEFDQGNAPSATSAAIYANNLRKTGTGIQLFSTCTGTQLLCNVMLDCYNGVFLSSCTYSDQGSSTAAADNYWNNQIDPTWFRVDGNANTVKWFYDATVDNNYNPNPHFPGITDVDNTPHSDCPDPTIVHLDPGDALRSIADGNIDYEDFQSEMAYSDQQFFYEKLKEDSVLMYSGEPTDSLFQELYNQLRSGNIGLFSGVKDMIRNYDFAQAYIRNQQIVDSNLMESNKRTVMEIFLYCKIHDTIPDSSQVVTLTNIAYQYPPAGGEAVYLARAILGLHIEDNLSGCDGHVSGSCHPPRPPI